MWKSTKFTRKRSFSRKYRAPSTRTLARTKAIKRFNWVEALDASCTPAYLLPHICAMRDEEVLGPSDMDCTTGVIDLVDPVSPTRIVLVPPADPAQTAGDSYSSDDVSVVRIVGHILMQPVWTLTAAALATIAAQNATVRPSTVISFLAQRHYWLRAGLRKETMILNPITREYEWPRRDPLDSLEWVDGRYVRQWEYETMPGQLGNSSTMVMVDGSKIGCYGNVQKAAQANSNIDTAQVVGTGGNAVNTQIGDPAITTALANCTIASPGTNQVQVGFALQPQRPIRISLNSRRRFRLRENEGLQMVINYTTVDYPSNAFAGCFPDVGHFTGVGWLARPHIKVLIET